ncbi:beta-1,3-glucan-binding protein-like isoform X1 [Bombus pyrosoma]|uniref:beta-1,3-glucan-binding protein-like isoform X1 n=1 Tax=Bombus pyrosoma TaxID=396416 RepID=UPI001CB97D83|nr:beta-1,3-glucan-binding protein-like isoform X1 [Bombus pyrosoma]
MFHYDICSISIFILLSSNLTSYLTLVNSYVVPTPTFEVLNPKGILISISDEPGLQFFAFQGNINRTIKLNEIGRISGEVYKKNNGKWIVQNRNMDLANGDVIHYWTYVQVNGIMYNRGEQTWTITDTNELVFNETFDIFNNSLWRHDIKIPLNPDYEFCIYHNRQHTFVASVKNGMLKIKPAILEYHYGVNATMYGTLILSECSSTIRAECQRKATSFSILPPVISARLVTKNSFHFRYGKIEIRAKFPEGDWLYPEMWLKPKYDYYGPDYSSGCIVLGLARGNDNLVNTVDGSIYDSRRLDFGVRIGTDLDIKNYMVSRTGKNGPRWTQDFHVYTTIWNSKGFQFLVDGEEVGKLNPPTDGWMYGNNFTKMAPFDQEFYIVIGVGVGGIRVFPDKTTSSGHIKPWKNIEAKAMLNFWHAEDKWLPSWGEKTAFEIDYIRVWSA